MGLYSTTLFVEHDVGPRKMVFFTWFAKSKLEKRHLEQVYRTPQIWIWIWSAT